MAENLHLVHRSRGVLGSESWPITGSEMNIQGHRLGSGAERYHTVGDVGDAGQSADHVELIRSCRFTESFLTGREPGIELGGLHAGCSETPGRPSADYLVKKTTVRLL
jgi:hypothetical protein